MKMFWYKGNTSFLVEEMPSTNFVTLSYDELRSTIMSEETKKTVKEAQEFFKKVQEGTETFQGIPDKQLTEKIRKVGEGAGEVVKHIEKRTDHQDKK